MIVTVIPGTGITGMDITGMDIIGAAGTGLLAAIALLAAAAAMRPGLARQPDNAPRAHNDASPTAHRRRPPVPLQCLLRTLGQPARRRRQRRHAREVERHLPAAVELVVLAVRAGHLPFAAVEASVPLVHPCIQPAFAQVVAQVRAGARFADALDALPHHLGAAAQPLARSLAAAERYGLPLAPVLDRLAADARADRRRRLETLARQLPVRLALPLVLCTLPAFVLMAVVPLLLAALSSLRT